jgi:hypothetical protein
MHITGTELAAASSAVAALAIVGGYLGVHSANRNALKIAREERSARRKDELDALKRTTYVKTLADLTALATARMEQGTGTNIPEAVQTALTSLAELELVSESDPLRNLATETYKKHLNALRKTQRHSLMKWPSSELSLSADLRGREMPNFEELKSHGQSADHAVT